MPVSRSCPFASAGETCAGGEVGFAQSEASNRCGDRQHNTTVKFGMELQPQLPDLMIGLPKLLGPVERGEGSDGHIRGSGRLRHIAGRAISATCFRPRLLNVIKAGAPCSRRCGRGTVCEG